MVEYINEAVDMYMRIVHTHDLFCTESEHRGVQTVHEYQFIVKLNTIVFAHGTIFEKREFLIIGVDVTLSRNCTAPSFGVLLFIC